jgi:hypothetical protein
LYYRLDEDTTDTVGIPSSKAPIIDTVNLVSEWESYGDAIDNSITQAEVGSIVNIAPRYWYWAESKTIDVLLQVRVYDENNERIGMETNSSNQLTDSNGWSSWESSVSFISEGWGQGTYTAEVLIRDNQSNETSSAGTVEFELV